MAEPGQSLDDMMSSADARTLNVAGNAFADRGMWNEATEAYERSRVRYAQMGDRRGEAIVLNNLGAICYATGDWESALDYYQEALGIVRALADRDTELLTAMNICFLTYAQTGRTGDELDRAEALAKELGKDDPLTKIYWMRGDAAFHDAETLPQAFHFYALACVHAERAGGDLLEKTIGYVDEHRRLLGSRGQSLAALAFCDHMLEVGRGQGMPEAFLQRIERMRREVLSPPQLGC